MPTMPFGEYRPDLSDFEGGHTRFMQNVIPRGDGYGPFRAPEDFSDALGEACRGYFYARRTDGSVAIFAATETRLYLMNNTTLAWADVSQGGSAYNALPITGQWQFAQFGTNVIAVQANADPQVFNLASSMAFADLGGSPPRASYIGIVNRFVVLSGLTSFPNRVQWSGLNEIDNYTAGTNSSDYQDLPDGGNVRPVVGGEFGWILQDSAIRRMTFSPGSETIFDIQRVAKDNGIRAPYSLAFAGEHSFFYSQKGFVQLTGAGEILPIGEEKVNRTFLEDYDAGDIQLVIGAGDPESHSVLWVYKSNSNTDPTFDKGLIYNYLLQRWTPVQVEGEYLASLATPGLTLEGLDEIAPGAQEISDADNSGSGEIRLTVGSTSGWTTGDYKTISAVTGTTEANGTWEITVVDGTHIDLNGSTFANAYVSGGIVAGSLDAIPFPLDTVSNASLPRLSIVNASHRIAFFSGDSLEATLETSEQSGDGRRLRVKGFWPITDASDVRGRVGKRENLNTIATYTGESSMNAQGYVPRIWETRYARAKIRIPAGVAWTFVSGVKPDFALKGRR